MGNDEAFRKVRDKLAGFESDVPDDSWHLFEKHRLKKERDRKLAGALGFGMLIIFILGILIGSWIFLAPGNRIAQESKKTDTSHQKQGVSVEGNKNGKPTHPELPEGDDQRNSYKKDAAGEIAATDPAKASAKLPDVVPVISLSGSSYNDPGITSSISEPDLPVLPNALVSRGPLLYAVNLQLPPIPISEMSRTEGDERIPRGFQLSMGPAVRANYARPSENRLTLGPAIFATFPISTKLSLRGGLALMREHVYVSNANPVFNENAVRWLNRGDYRWWDAEIPVDLQIRLHDNPKYSLSGLFGASSSVSWGEHFKELYQKDKIITTTLALHNGEVREVQELVSKQEEPFAGRRSGAVFTPAAYLNASIIIEKKVTAGSSVVIEPQFRYPIGGVTSRNLKFTSIGLQIRILYK